MVSNEQRAMTSRVTVAALVGYGVLAIQSWAQEPAKKYYVDDPLLQEPSPRAVTSIRPRRINETYDFLYNSFVVIRREQKAATNRAVPAKDVNTLGDVPNNSWYTHRHFYRRMSIEELKRGPGNSTPPSPTGTWRVVSAKSDGATPGFVIEDELRHRYLLKLDSPNYPELASAADVIGSKFFYALGYNTPENYIVHCARNRLVVSDGALWRDASGIKRPITQRVLDDLLRRQPIRPDGTYRALASRWIGGKLVGPFLYQGMRTDDPNDTIPHEDRRVLRGFRVFAAWLNHQDSRSINSMDALVEEGGVPHIKHYLMDFGSILGSNANISKDAWYGNQYVFEDKGALVQIATLGLHVPKWARAFYPRITGVGLMEYRSFDPVSWKPTYPNPAFLRMDLEDAFWAAKQVAAFTEAEIRAIVETGEYSDPAATEWITRCLVHRARKIADVWLSQFAPVDNFAVVNRKLTFEDVDAARDDRKPRRYKAHWMTLDSNGKVEIFEGEGLQVPEFNAGTQLVTATITYAVEDGREQAVIVDLRPGDAGLKVVGVERKVASAAAERTPGRNLRSSR